MKNPGAKKEAKKQNLSRAKWRGRGPHATARGLSKTRSPGPGRLGKVISCDEIVFHHMNTMRSNGWEEHNFLTGQSRPHPRPPPVPPPPPSSASVFRGEWVAFGVSGLPTSEVEETPQTCACRELSSDRDLNIEKHGCLLFYRLACSRICVNFF